ncbi:MAG: DUF5666 domain-containing protein [Burkholderiaceae bacterium]
MIRRYFSVATIIALLAACGGGVTTDVAPGGGGTGNPGTAETLGSISSTSPLTINGFVFPQTNPPSVPAIEDNDDDGRGLLPGMILRVQGGFGANEQTRTVINANMAAQVRGPVSSNMGELRVMGVAVVANNATVFENQRADNAGPQVGDEMQVHGFPTADGRILATRLVRRASNTVYKTTGVIKPSACLCPPDRTLFSIGTLSVWVPAAVATKFGQPLQNGMLVRVKADGPPVNDTIVATEIKLHAGAPLLADAQSSVQGVVSNVAAENSAAGGPARLLFTVNGIAAAATSETRFQGDSASDLVEGRLADVQGIARPDGIAATTIKFLPF